MKMAIMLTVEYDTDDYDYRPGGLTPVGMIDLELKLASIGLKVLSTEQWEDHYRDG